MKAFKYVILILILAFVDYFLFYYFVTSKHANQIKKYKEDEISKPAAKSKVNRIIKDETNVMDKSGSNFFGKKYTDIKTNAAVTTVLIPSRIVTSNAFGYNSTSSKLLDNKATNKATIKHHIDSSKSTIKQKHNYLVEINANRINSLLSILQSAESKNRDIFQRLDLIVFDELVENKSRDDRNVYRKFKNEINSYLEINENKTVKVTQEFIEFLNKVSVDNIFERSRTHIVKQNMSEADLNITIIIAADKNFFSPLQATMYYIHRYFPKNRLIFYDMGLESDMLRRTINNCKCTIRSLQNITTLPLIHELTKYAWKPLVVQDALKDYDHVMYMDTSIEIKSNEIAPVLEASRKLGLLVPFIGFQITCYTNSKVFDWLHDSSESLQGVLSIDANFLLFYKNFINSLIMKAWVTCALDGNCIAPSDSVLWPCCGCHRYDQSLLTIFATYFYSIPIDSLPAFALTVNESYFHSVERGHFKMYF